MEKLEQLANYLSEYKSIKQLVKAILDKKTDFQKLAENNFLIKLNIAEYKQLLINQLNELIDNNFLKATYIPKQLKSIYFDSKKYKNLIKIIIRDKIDNIVYPSIYDYYIDKIESDDICLAIQCANKTGNLEFEQAIYNLEEEIKQYFWKKTENDTLLENKTKRYFLSAFEISDLSKRILFLVAGGKNNMSDVIQIDSNTIDILLKDERLINIEPYYFYNREELSKILNGIKIRSLKIFSDSKSLIKIQFNSENEETNFEFIKEIKNEIDSGNLVIPKLKEMAIIKIIDNCYEEVLKYHQTLKNGLQLLFNINNEKQKLEKQLLNQIKDEIFLNEKIKKIYDIDYKNQNFQIKKIKILIMKNIEKNEISEKNQASSSK